jgi:4-hydroxy-tetrahydrodipicolinate synthase
MKAPVDEGIVVPIITPLDEQERVDAPALRRTVDFLIQGGVHGIFTMGSTGEFASLSQTEWRRGVETAIDAAGGRVPVLAGVTTPGTRTTLERLEEVQRLGADAAVAILPYYFMLDEEEMFDYYRQLSEASSIPVYAYNTGLTKMYYTRELVARLATLERIVGYKDSSGNFTLFQELVARHDNECFRIFQGNELTLVTSLFVGAHGAVAGLGNVAPRLCVDLFEACKRRDYDASLCLHQKMLTLHRICRLNPSIVAHIKYAMSLYGLGSERCARPLKPVPPEQKEIVRATLQELDLL